MSAHHAADVLSFDAHLGRMVGPPSRSETLLTLRAYYFTDVRPQIEHQRPGSLAEDRVALKNWELHTGNPDIRSISRDHLVLLRDGLLAAGRSKATVNKTWREIKAMLEIAKEDGVIARVPKIGLRMKTKLVRPDAKIQRDIISDDELTRLWRACDQAMYPQRGAFPTVAMWRALIYLFRLYGPRTRDLFYLKWDSIKPKKGLIQFEAMKTSKLQGLPLTDLASRQIEQFRGIDADYVFPGFRSHGCFLKGPPGRWVRGYYTTWRTEICPAAGITSPIVFKHFRETMVSTLNGVEPNLGNWIAGHYVPGVSAQSYDMPTARVRAAIERVPIPSCFQMVEPDANRSA
jgi:integrase